MHDENLPEPLAIIGIGCHFPGGATSPATFWELLLSGVDATREVPSDRWDVRKFYDPDTRKSGKTHTYRGGYLERLDLFDAHFFGISPREALWLDPQQRLLLQVTWEALEDAGEAADRLAGSNTGVFVGGFTLDYQLVQNFGRSSRHNLQAHAATGFMMTMLANRISYVFGFHGPSMTVDTACSSSLVAVHLACQSIWNGDCPLAIAGGVNAMISPAMSIVESKGGFLSPEGRCKAFDAAADGYARGEGAGVIVIKSLAQAQADGNPIYALIRGTAVNQDGHTNGITVPNQQAQEAVMRSAYQRAGILPKDVQYVEAHGTGTPVGDPVEARAIGTVLSADRPVSQQCVIGSVKTNIGHLEAAAGIAALIKTALMVKYRQIPPHLLFHVPHPDIPFEELQLHVPTTVEPWPATNVPALAGVNSFGFGGTNAHVVLQEPPAVSPIDIGTDEQLRPYLLPLSARSAEALQAVAESYRNFLIDKQADPSCHFHDIAFSASLRRSHHDHRLALVAHSQEEAIAHLETFLAHESCRGMSTGRAPLNEQPKTVFVCSGMGPQWWAMGRDLLIHEPIFRASIERCDAELRRYASWSLLEILTAPESRSPMQETEFAQPANFAVQVALAELWRSWGIQPDAIVGHSAGEAAAQYLAGALSWEDAVCVIYHRSRLQQLTSGTGQVMAAGMSFETAKQIVSDYAEHVSIAAINSPSAVTLSGDATALEKIARRLQAAQVFHRFLQVKVPYHSHYMEPLREELLTVLADLHPQSASLPLYSTVTGTRIDGCEVDADYWWQNVRAPVLFASAVSRMIKDKHTVFIELSPHPVLASSISELLAQHGEAGTVLPSLRRQEEDRTVMRGSLGTLYTLGYPIAWSTLYQQGGNFIRLPAYPWQLKQHWTESAEWHEHRLLTLAHPLLGQRMKAAHPTWELELNPRHLPYLADHRIQESVLLPGAAFVEMMRAAAQEVFGPGEHLLEGLEFRKALFIPDILDPTLQTILNPELATVEIYSSTLVGDARWTLHARAKLRRIQSSSIMNRVDLNDIQAHCTAEISREAFYRQSQEMGLQYGPAFQAIERVQILQYPPTDRGNEGNQTSPSATPSVDDYNGKTPNTSRSHRARPDGFALGHLHVPVSLEVELATYYFHPALLDAAFQVLLAARPTEGLALQYAAAPYLPVRVDRMRILGRPSQHMQVFAHMLKMDERLAVGDIQIVDAEGNLLVEIEGFHAQSLESSRSLTPEHIDRGLYEVEWQLAERSAQEDSDNEGITRAEAISQGGTWLIFTDQSGVGAALTGCLKEHGEGYVTVSYTDAPQMMQQGNHYRIDPTNPEHFKQLFTALSATHQAPFSRIVHLWSLDSAFGQGQATAPTTTAFGQGQATAPTTTAFGQGQATAPTTTAFGQGQATAPTTTSILSALEQEQALGCLAVMHLVQALSQTGWSHLTRLWLVTRGAQAVGAKPGPIAVDQAPLWGLGRVIGHQEHSGIWGGMVDLDPALPANEVSQLFAELWNATDEDQIAFRAGQRYLIRLIPSTHLTPPLPPSFRPDGAYLITGGLGALGLLVARWMAAQGARRLILMGRTMVPPRSTWHQLETDHPQRGLIQAIRELETLGATVHLAAVDVADEVQLSTFLEDYEHEGWPPIRGLVHAAGTVQDELLLRMSAETFKRVLRPKVRGGWLLHDLLKDHPLDFFILFSSAASVIASVGQGNYAAANAFLDALASHRRSLGLPALSIGWGPWSVGMVNDLNLAEYYVKRGIELITPEVGMQILARLLEQHPAQLTVISANWALARETSPLGVLPAIFSRLGKQGEETSAGDADTGEGSILQRLDAVQMADRQPLLESHLHELVARVLQLDQSQFSSQEPLTSLGMDSLMAIELKHRIEGSLKVDISILELLQGITIIQLTTRILSSVQLSETSLIADSTLSTEEIQKLIERLDSEEVERLLTELEQMSEDDL